MTKRDKERLARLLKAKPEEVYFDRDDDYDGDGGVALWVGKREMAEPRRDTWGYTYHPEKLDKYIGGLNFQQTTCCGMAEIVNAGDLESVPERVRPYLVKGVLDELKGFGYGNVIATTVARQRSAATALRQAGFKAKERFKSGKTGNQITLWSANLKQKGRLNRPVV